MDFIPANIDIGKETVPLSQIIEKLSKSEIVYSDRNMSVEKMSTIIENILLKFVLPRGVFNEEIGSFNFIIGQNIVETLDKFVVKESFSLDGFVYFPDLNGKKFSELPPQYKRRIKECFWDISRIYRNTSSEIAKDIANRYSEMIENSY